MGPKPCERCPWVFALVFMLYWVFTTACCREWGILSTCGAWPAHWGGFSCSGAKALAQEWAGFSSWALGLENEGSVIMAHGLGGPEACGIFPHQRLNPCPLHWQVDSYPLDHQGSPKLCFIKISTDSVQSLLNCCFSHSVAPDSFVIPWTI